MIEKDTLWKGIIEDLFPEMMAFFYPEAVEGLDFTQVEFLDKELQQLFPEAAKQRRYADKLVKVGRKSGPEVWLLVHIEVQGYVDQAFAERMFRYYYRIFDRYGMEIEALALLTDKRRRFKPAQYERRALRTSLHYQFHSYKLLDQDEAALAKDPNPFALVLLTALEALRSGKLPDVSLLEQKLQLLRKLVAGGFDRRTILLLTTFIKYYVRFEGEEMSHKFDDVTTSINQSNRPMGIVEAILHEVETNGIEQGIEQGIENLLIYGLPPLEISKALVVSPERVQQVAERLRKEGKLK